MKILYVTTISLTVNSFFKPHIKMLVDCGNQVDIACNYSNLELDRLYTELGCNFYQVDFSRSPLSPSNIKAYRQLKEVIKNGEYDIVHCHTPNAAVITRLVCKKFRKKNLLKVFYTAHGFHFYKGAPLKNWLIYYTAEKFCSRFTDKLITINSEDFELAENKFKAKEVVYIPGVGIDLSKLKNVNVDRAAKRRELGIPEDSFLVISVGEMSARKNHITVLKAIAESDSDKIHYLIVGNGPMKKELMEFTEKNNISDKVHFAGFRRDIAELYKASDICCFPSIHEGLPVALMEAMACGVPIVCGRIRGNVDLVKEDAGFLVDPHSKAEFAESIDKLMKDPELCQRFSALNLERVNSYSIDSVIEKIKALY